MNTITPIGAPNSLVRKFQERPELAIECYSMLKALVAAIEAEDDNGGILGCCKDVMCKIDSLDRFNPGQGDAP